MSKVLKSQESAWIEFAAAAMSGYLASAKYDENAPKMAAKQADKLLAELEQRIKNAHGE